MAKRFRTALAIAALAMTLVVVCYLDSSDLSFYPNRSAYMAIISGVCTAINMLILNRTEAKKARAKG
jgi:hypothetical protein